MTLKGEGKRDKGSHACKERHSSSTHEQKLGHCPQGYRDNSCPALDIQLHVKNVPVHCDLPKLLSEFRPFGRMIEDESTTYIVMDKNSKVSKGRAFIHFESLDRADTAIAELHKSRCLDAHSCPLEVEYRRGETERLGLPGDAGTADFENKLFVGNLPKDYNESQVQQLFHNYGPVREVRIVRGAQQSKGAAFVKLQSKEQALISICDFSSRPVILGKRKVEVRYAESRRHPKVQASQVALLTEGVAFVRPEVIAPWPVHFSNDCYPPGGMAETTAQNYFRGELLSHSHHDELEMRGDWTRAWTSDGMAYYYHNRSRLCQWNPPPEFLTGLTTGIFNTSAVSITGSPVIVVSQIPPSWCEKDLATYFAQIGAVEEVRIALDRECQSRCFGYIRFGSSVSASNAEVAMSGRIVGEKRLRVRQVEPEAIQSLWPPPDA